MDERRGKKELKWEGGGILNFEHDVVMFATILSGLCACAAMTRAPHLPNLPLT